MVTRHSTNLGNTGSIPTQAKNLVNTSGCTLKNVEKLSHSILALAIHIKLLNPEN